MHKGGGEGEKEKKQKAKKPSVTAAAQRVLPFDKPQPEQKQVVDPPPSARSTRRGNACDTQTPQPVEAHA